MLVKKWPAACRTGGELLIFIQVQHRKQEQYNGFADKTQLIELIFK